MHIYTMMQELNRLFPTGTRISNKELKIRTDKGRINGLELTIIK